MFSADFAKEFDYLVFSENLLATVSSSEVKYFKSIAGIFWLNNKLSTIKTKTGRNPVKKRFST